MNYNTQNAKIASIMMLAVKYIMQGHLTGGIMSTLKTA